MGELSSPPLHCPWTWKPWGRQSFLSRRPGPDMLADE